MYYPTLRMIIRKMQYNCPRLLQQLYELQYILTMIYPSSICYRRSRVRLFSILALLLAVQLGCTAPKNPGGRENIEGLITLNGAPLTGMSGIVFSPVNPGSDGGGQGQIQNGKYFLTGADGVKPGKYIVRITSSIDFDIRTGKPADSAIEFGSEIPVDVVPSLFNKESTIEFDVTAGKKNIFNYDIQTDYVPKMPPDARPKDAIPL
jgi:hypothetical protein